MSKVACPLVVSSPSGGGKSTLLKKLLAEFPGVFGFSVSHTTRKPRAGEVDGVHYKFVSKEQFDDLIKNNKFIEHATYSGNKYGTSYDSVKAIAEQGKICILEVEMQGVKLLKACKDMKPKYLFIEPPSIEVIKQRLLERKTESEESLAMRLDAARLELEYAKTGAHDKVVVNDDLEKAYAEMREWIIQMYRENWPKAQ